MTSPPPSSNISKTFYNDSEGVCVGGGRQSRYCLLKSRFRVLLSFESKGGRDLLKYVSTLV